ncbi:Iron-sulfur assembly protein [Vigna angularis]|uniref:Iron-sulfur assembly protein n=1 Tax=Phaseolus angularis TaxID=3914 RepID=A0A8T0L6E3_PHAAN|nr:Iron-sulfur assembly protein [Vigna angularis]
MIRSLALHWAARFRHNQNLLRLSSSYASPATLHHATPSSSSAEPVHITPNCVRKIKELEASESSTSGKMLRLSVETGGCSGFQYVFNLDDRINSDDRSATEKRDVTENPSAVGGCSCKSSFMVKQL